MRSISEESSLPAAVSKMLLRAGVSRGERVLVAVSGGADSTALLDALTTLDRFSLRLRAIHVEHGIRPAGERAEDLEFLRELSLRLGIGLEIEKIDEGTLGRIAEGEHRSLEEVAREERYARIGQSAERWPADWIVTAHTQDDQLETLLMRMLAGGASGGLSGIPWRRGRILRPLIQTSREQVLDYLRFRGLSYRTDSTNSSERYLRNRVRRRLIPLVHELFPSAGASAERFAEETASWGELLDECSTLLLPWEPAGEGFRLRAADFFAAPLGLRTRSVLRLYNAAGHGERIPAGFFKPLETASNRRSGGRILVGHGARLEHLGEWVFWLPDVVLKSKKSYLMRVFEPSVYHITPTLCLRVSTEPKGNAGGQRIGLPQSTIRPPLVVRSRKPGDAIQVKDGKKTLKKLFNEWAVNETLRDVVPIIEDRRGILAVAGGFLGYRDRIRVSAPDEQSPKPAGAEIVFAFEYNGEKL